MQSRRYDRGQTNTYTDRQTDRHAYHNTPLPYRGRSNNFRLYIVWPIKMSPNLNDCGSRTNRGCQCHLVIFAARCYASAIAMGLCLSVCLSVRSRSSSKTAKLRITLTTPHDNPGTLVFWSQRSPWNTTGVTPNGGAKCRWGGSERQLGHTMCRTSTASRGKNHFDCWIHAYINVA